MVANSKTLLRTYYQFSIMNRLSKTMLVLACFVLLSRKCSRLQITKISQLVTFSAK